MLQESRADECVQTTHKLVSACFKVVGILIPYHVLKGILMFLTNKTSRAQVLVGEKRRWSSFLVVEDKVRHASRRGLQM